MAKFARLGDRIIGRIERARTLDHASHGLGEAVAIPFRALGGPGKRVRTALHGTSYGHSIHPALVTVPLGSWTASVLLDVADGVAGGEENRGFATAADLTIGIGCLGAAGAIVTGLVDWDKTHGEPRRLGVVHAAANTTALTLFLSSLILRRRGRRRGAKAVSALAFAAMFAGGYLGGHLAHRRNVGADHADRNPAPRNFVSVLDAAELEEGKPRLVEVEGVRVALVRHHGRIHALGDRCSHFGGPLSEGWVFRGGLVCPWHGSRYCLHSGRPLDGPATAVQPTFEVRVSDGMVEVRRPETRRDGALARDTACTAEPPSGIGDCRPKADEVLVGHHMLIRGLFDRIAATMPNDPHRLELLDELAGEMDMHEMIEDEIFYPRVRHVTDSIPIAGAEHQQLADQLAILLTLDPSTSDFDEHLTALRSALEHHAGSEEREMFPTAQRLGDAVLRDLGARLVERLEELRQSRLQKLVRLGRQVLLERGQGRIGRAMQETPHGASRGTSPR
ncbi:Rieske 2Fe-2S domain-containing protein [Azospirillum sp. SYSU D00513]|uniref:Rieske 2Fe-2S domain-containing protein n=1 Tax=Azospirillum sp. SYSU D00513 TaxID=2812561 RepID=UPI001A95FFE4|nr:Rieske 2Fe-2S domain-containing protein [Azospirillum sp. SYSU D00513]